jgi:hypothetical protein
MVPLASPGSTLGHYIEFLYAESGRPDSLLRHGFRRAPLLAVESRTGLHACEPGLCERIWISKTQGYRRGARIGQMAPIERSFSVAETDAHIRKRAEVSGVFLKSGKGPWRREPAAAILRSWSARS